MKVAVVSAYNNHVDLTREFLNTMECFWPPAEKQITPHLILVNGGCGTQVSHPFIAERIDLPRNDGFCATLNAGLRAVPGDADFVFFVGNDSFPVDDAWLPRLISLQQSSGAWMVCPANDRPGMRAYRHLYRLDCGFFWEVDFFPSIAFLMPREHFATVGLLDERFQRTGMYADNDYCRRVRLAGGRIVVSKDIMLRHLLSREGKTLGTQGEDMNINRGIFEEKWGSGFL